MSDIPDPKICECGHKVHWYTIDPDPNTTSVFYRIEEEAGVPHIKLHEDVVERDCPHRNGTVTEHCPQCDRQVGMWGMGVAGSMECDCWSMPAPWWRRLLDWAIIKGQRG